MSHSTKELSIQELLHNYAEILEELRSRGIVRTSNSPIGDYAEWLVSNKLGLKLEKNNQKGYDAFVTNGQNPVRYQIKGRRITHWNKSKQLSAIRNLEKHHFDFLIVVLFDEWVEVTKVVKIPYEIIMDYAKISTYVSAEILVLGNAILNNPKVEDITPLFLE